MHAKRMHASKLSSCGGNTFQDFAGKMVAGENMPDIKLTMLEMSVSLCVGVGVEGIKSCTDLVKGLAFVTYMV